MSDVRAHDGPEPVKLTLGDFELLHRSGAFDRLSRVELIEGVLLRKPAEWSRHSYVRTELGMRLMGRLKDMRGSVSALLGGTVAMPPCSAPEPAILLTSAARGEGYVPLETVSLVLEVSDACPAFDLREKAALYAKHEIPEYWVVEIPATTIHQFWAPSENGYRERRTVAFGEKAQSVTIGGLEIEADNLI